MDFFRGLAALRAGTFAVAAVDDSAAAAAEPALGSAVSQSAPSDPGLDAGVDRCGGKGEVDLRVAGAAQRSASGPRRQKNSPALGTFSPLAREFVAYAERRSTRSAANGKRRRGSTRQNGAINRLSSRLMHVGGDDNKMSSSRPQLAVIG